MLKVNTEIKASPLSGKGLFLREPVKKGQVIALFTENARYMTEATYQEEQRKNNQVVIMSAVRYIGEYFLYNEEIGEEEFINHSSEPTMIYHCGICFAKKDLTAGEELTVDYKYFLATGDENKFIDSRTSQPVDGLPPREALLQSARELLATLEESESE